MTQPIKIPVFKPENKKSKRFLAINYISFKEIYNRRFEELFTSRAHAIN
jgi:hypothetical protein